MYNQHPVTGVRYGVIALQSLNDDVQHELMFGRNAANVTEQEAEDEFNTQARAKFEEIGGEAMDIDRSVDREVEKLMEQLQIDEPQIEGHYEGVKYQVSWLGGAPMLWVIESPHLVQVNDLCSPCVPGAADLDSGLTDYGFECYGVPADWMEVSHA